MCNSVAGQENTDQQQAAAVASFLPDRQIPETCTSKLRSRAFSSIYLDEERPSFLQHPMIETWTPGSLEEKPGSLEEKKHFASPSVAFFSVF